MLLEEVLGLLLCLLDCGPLVVSLHAMLFPGSTRQSLLAACVTRGQLSLWRADFCCFSQMTLGPSLLENRVPEGGWGLPHSDGCRVKGVLVSSPCHEKLLPIGWPIYPTPWVWTLWSYVEIRHFCGCSVLVCCLMKSSNILVITGGSRRETPNAQSCDKATRHQRHAGRAGPSSS